ncbi:hypothetical protein like AT4G29090 [Hibiscus trionum]|uniref:Uncharacterized protein n=1 Tax=Hibiscus trionum TaxID=183268 RepID=A0A9W7M0M6_HIBTR|nr:hypothetical protein like AT4G29090 [Hibiscus trionum]
MPVTVANFINNRITSFIWGNRTAKPIHWIKRSQLCKPIEYGGLGIDDLSTKNRALLNKWLWRYGLEPSSLWRKVIDAKYNYDPNLLLPRREKGRKESWLWRKIMQPMFEPGNPFSQHTKLALGDGKHIEFWEDPWTEVPSLRSSFPRIYALALKKVGKFVISEQ